MMKKVLKILGKILSCILALILVLAIVMVIGYRHRSNPSQVISFETDNPHIGERTYISAHRSGAGIMPEETMMAFRNCVENEGFEVDYFEFDLHITRDDVLVLLHDDELDRTSDCETVFGREHVRAEEYTLEELRKLNMGAKFVNEAGEMPYSGLTGGDVPEDLRIVDLDTILDYLESNGEYRYIIEIKNGGDLGKKGVDILYASLKERNMLDRAVFGSFHGEVSDYKDAAYPDFMRGAYANEVIEFYLSSLINKKDFQPKYGVLQLPFHNPGDDAYINFGTASVLNYAHAHNLAIQYWTVNDEKDIEYLIGLRADCIMSDYPDLAWRVREASGK